MALFQQKHIIQFETSLSIKEFTERMVQLVDFNHHSYRSTAMITKDFFGDKLGPGKFSIRRKPIMPGLFDVFTGIGPYIEIKFEKGRVGIIISNGTYLPHFMIILVLLGLTFRNMGDFIPDLSFPGLILPIFIILGLSAFIVYLLKGRYRSVIRSVKRKLIENLKE